MRIKGKYVAEITITIDAEVPRNESEIFKKRVCEELTPMLRELMDEEVLDPEIGEAEVRQVSAELYEVDE